MHPLLNNHVRPPTCTRYVMVSWSVAEAGLRKRSVAVAAPPVRLLIEGVSDKAAWHAIVGWEQWGCSQRSMGWEFPPSNALH